MPRAVEIVDVSPRDGLQDEPSFVATAHKVELIQRLLAAGITRIEACSFVNPARVPQMADAEAVVAAVRRRPGARLIGLVLNERGFDRALAAGVDEVNVVVVVSDTFSAKNQGRTTEESLAMWSAVAKRAHVTGVRAGVTLSAAFGCPYEGVVPLARVVAIAGRALEAGPVELAVADTIGVAVPTEVSELVGTLVERTGVPVRCHLHDTRGAGIPNALAAVAAGAAALDAGLGGLGGCPFAPGAAGNVATERLVHELEGRGIRTGIHLDALTPMVGWLEGIVGHRLRSDHVPAATDGTERAGGSAG